MKIGFHKYHPLKMTSYFWFILNYTSDGNLWIEILSHDNLRANILNLSKSHLYYYYYFFFFKYVLLKIIDWPKITHFDMFEHFLKSLHDYALQISVDCRSFWTRHQDKVWMYLCSEWIGTSAACFPVCSPPCAQRNSTATGTLWEELSCFWAHVEPRSSSIRFVLFYHNSST